MRNSITNCDIETNDLAWIQKMVAGPENIDGLDWVDEDELTGEEITDIRQLEAFGVTDQSLKKFKKMIKARCRSLPFFLSQEENKWQNQREKQLHRL